MKAESKDQQVDATFYLLEIAESMTETLMLWTPRSLRAALEHALKKKLLIQIYCLIFVEKVKTN